VRGQSFDMVVSNPPYLPGRGRPRRHSAARAWEAGPSGRALLDRICGEAAAYLSPGGVLLLVQSSVSGEQETLRALAASGLRAAVSDRRPGPLGPRLRAREPALRDRGLLREDGWEEILVIRAVSSGSEVL
jgi:release factor glutamine methyltransferase